MFVLVRCVELKKGKPSLSCLAADDVQLEPTSPAVTTFRREEVTNTGLVKENVYKAGSNAICDTSALVVSAKNVDDFLFQACVVILHVVILLFSMVCPFQQVLS